MGLDVNEVYIQRGVKKVYNNGYFEYVSDFSMNIDDRDGYCIDSRGVNSFFYKIDGECRFVECNSNISYDRYVSLNEIKSGYINLYDFIDNGIFVGREFIRTVPVITYLNKDNIFKDNAYLCSESKYIVLYAKDNMFLAKYIYGNYEEYCIIDCRYVNDGMYKFIGDVYEEYMDKEMVCLEIFKQIDDYCEKKSKVKVKNK